MENDFDWQGKRKDQVETSYKIIAYSTLAFLLSMLFLYIYSLL